MALSIFGGLIAGGLAGIVSRQEYIAGITGNFQTRYLVIGLIKSFIYGFIISSIAAYQGFYTSGGALDVGKSSTRAVVFSSVAILLFDYIVAQLFL